MSVLLKAVIVVVVIIILVRILKLESPKTNAELERLKLPNFKKKGNRPKVVITGGAHGDEPAGTIALQEMLADGDFSQYRGVDIIVIPILNKSGARLGTRETASGVDLNREFRKDDASVHPAIRDLRILSRDADLTIDLHEGWGWKRDGLGSIGSSIYHSVETDGPLVRRIAEDVGFEVLPPTDIVAGTYSEWRRGLGARHFLVETTGKKDIQPLRLRVTQHKKIVRGILDNIFL